jgi:hypothetical protein
MKTYFLLFISIFFLSGCKQDEVVSVKELIMKVWKVQTVRENSTVVYSISASSNIRPTYNKFQLDLRDSEKVIFIDVDGRTVTGTWVLVEESRILLQNLMPAPTGTNGAIEFYFTSLPTQSTLELFRSTESKKTGGTRNEYSLIPEN